ncbi:hypothetical protein EGR_07695 [Echinococcus granulosus]|uniref:Uncharacterized protein n=1 Tax=Echinococcus granulosus TaxID=6210 RepID=W6U8C4_ECHGR|nr:hypothetical protein EGR_07695 [Echinococcus granulosus]EUB57453.1 hypothetical protein EGR_07695 [Echinococcus granulosus]
MSNLAKDVCLYLAQVAEYLSQSEDQTNKKDILMMIGGYKKPKNYNISARTRIISKFELMEKVKSYLMAIIATRTLDIPKHKLGKLSPYLRTIATLERLDLNIIIIVARDCIHQQLCSVVIKSELQIKANHTFERVRRNVLGVVGTKDIGRAEAEKINEEEEEKKKKKKKQEKDLSSSATKIFHVSPTSSLAQDLAALNKGSLTQFQILVS